MSVEILPYAPSHVAAVKDFNRRLRRGGIDFQFPETPSSESFPPVDGAFPRQDYRVAVDGAEVRGGYILKSEDFWSTQFGRQRLGNYQLPLSEGIVDSRFSAVGVQLLWDVLAQNERLYSLGMGGVTRPLPRMLAQLGWTVEEVPFYFRVIHAGAFAREIKFLRARPGWAPVLDLARYSGLAALGVAAWDLSTRLMRPKAKRTAWRRVDRFGAEIDAFFTETRTSVEALCDRNAKALTLKFPERDDRFIRIVIEADGKIVGWAVLTRSQLAQHKQFGDLKLGAIADNLAQPGFEAAVVRASFECLRHEGMDLVVTNQTHARWRLAFQEEGFLKGPSNFALARSPQLFQESGALGGIHFTRGDGDGPINL